MVDLRGIGKMEFRFRYLVEWWDEFVGGFIKFRIGIFCKVFSFGGGWGGGGSLVLS